MIRQVHMLRGCSIALATIFVVVYLSHTTTPMTRANPDVVIDTYNDTAQTVSQTGIGTTDSFDDTPGTDVLGGERDVIVQVTQIGAANSLNSIINSGGFGQLAHSQDAGVRGRTIYTYDGDDDDGANLAFNLGSVDLSNDDAFIIELIQADLGVDATITYYTTDATNCSSQTQTLRPIAGSAAPLAIVFAYSNFSTACANPGVISDVDAIVLEIDGTGTDSADVVIDSYRTAVLDYGDLPGGCSGACLDFANTTLSDDGAAHVVGPLFLGATIDSEPDGQEDPTPMEANEDDNDGNNDHDGVVRTPGNWTNGGTAAVEVTSTGLGCLSAWIDFSNLLSQQTDGDFDDPNENIIDNAEVVTGTQTLTFTVATDPTSRGFFTRFRLYPRDPGNVCVSPKDDREQAVAGEVEDYWWSFGPTAVGLDSTEVATSTAWYLPLFLLSLLLVASFILVRRKQSA